MNLTCSICTELFVPSDDVYFTPCGHFFHFICVTHWLQRSRTCPQCRNKVTESTIRRAYFNFVNTDANNEDSGILNSKIDTLNFDLLQRERELKDCKEDNIKSKNQISNLKAQVQKLDAEIAEYKSAIYALKEQVKHFKKLSLDAEIAKKEIVRLNSNLEQYRNIQTIISESQEEVEKLVNETHDVKTLNIYIAVLKREMEGSAQRRREFRAKLKVMEQEINKLKTERHCLLEQETKCRQLEENLTHSDNENKSLRVKIEDLENRLRSEAKSQLSEDIQRYIAESPAPEKPKKNVLTPANLESNAVSPDRSLNAENTEKSPQLPIKSRGVGACSALGQSSRLKPLSSGLSILKKRPRLTAPSKAQIESMEMQYDGYGGHSKVDEYPISSFRCTAKKNNLLLVKTKRRKINDKPNKRIDNFFDLT